MAALFSCFQILTLTSFAYSLKLRREKFPHVKVIFQSVLNRDIQYVSPKEVVKRYLHLLVIVHLIITITKQLLCALKKITGETSDIFEKKTKKNTALALLKTR